MSDYERINQGALEVMAECLDGTRRGSVIHCMALELRDRRAADTPQPCGHSRAAIDVSEDGTSHCVACLTDDLHERYQAAKSLLAFACYDADGPGTQQMVNEMIDAEVEDRKRKRIATPRGKE